MKAACARPWPRRTGRYTLDINFCEGWRGTLWQGRFASFSMDEPYLLACARTIELNPVRAGLTQRPGDRPWHRPRAHLAGRDDAVVSAGKLLDLVPDWGTFLDSGLGEDERDAIRAAERTGRPLGSAEFTKRLEARLGRTLARQKPGPKPAAVVGGVARG